jgi:hypothetical protein
MYDKDFQMLNTNEFQDKRNSQLQPIDLEKAQANETWPLPSPTKPASIEEKADTNTKSQANEQGGYKLTPNIPQAQSPRVASPKLAPPIVSAGESQPKTTRLPDPGDESKEKKSCCCIVM